MSLLISLRFVGYLIVFFGAINLVRMAIFLIGSDIYSLREYLRRRNKGAVFAMPTFTIVIPTHNEKHLALRGLKSVLANDYPKRLFHVVVVDDGSTDGTHRLLTNFVKKHHLRRRVSIYHQKNRGKARALNFGIKRYKKGEIVMCLDGDSMIAPEALRKAAPYFSDPTVMAIAANIKIIRRPGILNLIQQFEYTIAYQMKRAHTVFNIEYIIGGIGSTFRRSMLSHVGYYDTNTVTEDIDLTMKILSQGNKTHRAIYGSDIIAYTESVLTIPALINQRFRWKYGRMQTFYKHYFMFFNNEAKYTKGLTWIYLPYALFSEVSFMFEPLLVTYILAIAIIYRDSIIILSAICVISAYIIFNVLSEDTIAKKDKWKLILMAPTMYFYFYVLSFVEYIALMKTIVGLKSIKRDIEKNICNWQQVRRPEIAIFPA